MEENNASSTWQRQILTPELLSMYNSGELTLPLDYIATEIDLWFVGTVPGAVCMMLHHGLYHLSMSLWQDELIPRAARLNIFDEPEVKFDLALLARSSIQEPST